MRTVQIEDTHTVEESSNHYGAYTGLFYFLFQAITPLVLTGTNMLGSYAPNPQKSLGRVVLNYMTWSDNVEDAQITDPLYQYIMPTLFVIALGCVISTQCTSGKTSEKEDNSLSENRLAELRFDRRMHTLAIMTHVLTGTNLPLVLVGSFANGFFLDKKDFSTSAYMGLSAFIGTSLITTALYLIYGLACSFKKCCCIPPKPQVHISEGIQATIPTGTASRQDGPGHVVIQMQPLSTEALSTGHPRGHRRSDSDHIRRVVRETLSVVNPLTGESRTTYDSREDLTAVGRTRQGEAIIARRQEIQSSGSPLFIRRGALPQNTSVEVMENPHVPAAGERSSPTSPGTP